MNKHLLGVSAAAVAGALVGAAIVASRFVLQQTDPASLALMRYAIGFVFLVVPVMTMTRVPFERRDLLPIALLGIFQFGVLIALLNYALLTISSARAALIFATFPLITMLLAALMGREKLSVAKTIGVLLTIAGVGLALGEDIFVTPDPDKGWVGELAAFASAVTGAVCSVLYGPYLRKYPTVQVSAFAMVASVFFLVFPAASEGFFDSVPDFTIAGWVSIVFVGWASAIGYFLWLFGLRHVPPTQVTVFLSLNPITAVVLGAIILAEPVTSWVIAGIACVGAGLWFALGVRNP